MSLDNLAIHHDLRHETFCRFCKLLWIDKSQLLFRSVSEWMTIISRQWQHCSKLLNLKWRPTNSITYSLFVMIYLAGIWRSGYRSTFQIHALTCIVQGFFQFPSMRQNTCNRTGCARVTVLTAKNSIEIFFKYPSYLSLFYIFHVGFTCAVRVISHNRQPQTSN